MKECKGIMGKLFGHSFESFITKYTPPSNFSADNISTKGIKATSSKEYIVICSRCGIKGLDK